MVWNRRGIALTALGAAVAMAVLAGAIALAMHQDTAGKLALAPKPAPKPSPAHSQGPLRSPFTGLRVHRLNRVLIVKIGNTFPERPATGLARADIVYLIPVEGGQTGGAVGGRPAGRCAPGRSPAGNARRRPP